MFRSHMTAWRKKVAECKVWTQLQPLECESWYYHAAHNPLNDLYRGWNNNSSLRDWMWYSPVSLSGFACLQVWLPFCLCPRSSPESSSFSLLTLRHGRSHGSGWPLPPECCRYNCILLCSVHVVLQIKIQSFINAGQTLDQMSSISSLRNSYF